MIKLVSFDFNGTLARERTRDLEVIRGILSDLGFSIGEERVREAFRRAREWWEGEKGKGRIWSEEAMAEFVRRALDQLGIPVHLSHRVAEMWPRRLEFEAFEDTLPVLERLSGEYVLAIVSNSSSRRNLVGYLRSAGINPSIFSFIASSGSVGYEKPDPRIFLLVCRELGVDPSEAVHVGDDPSADCEGAKRAGLFPVLVDRKGVHASARWVRLGSLSELPPLLESLSGRSGRPP